jgi:hypothetical protein
MIPVSQHFQDSLSNDVQIVRPKVTAWMSDLRSLNNIKVNTTTHSYEKQIVDRNPQMYIKFDKSNFDSSSSSTSITSFDIANERVYVTAHGLKVGTAVSFSTVTTYSSGVATTSVLPTGITAGRVYYIQEVATDYFCLNYFRETALNNSSIYKILLSGTYSGTSNITWYNTRLQDQGKQKLSFAYGESTSKFPAAQDGYYSILSDAIDSRYKQIFEPKRLIDTFNRTSPNSLGFFTSSDTTDASMGYYSWQTNDNNWIISSNQAKYITNQYTDDIINYMKCSVKSLDHFVDFKSNATPGTRAYVRFVDDTHYVSLNTTTSANTGIWVNNGNVSTRISVNPTVLISNGTPCVITLNNHGLPAGTLVKFYTSGSLPTGITAGTSYYVQNPATNTFNLNTIRANSLSPTNSTGRVNTSTAGSGTHQMSFGLQTDHYYRLQAKYNLYYFYDMGTSEPTNSSTGTLLYSGYHDYNEIFKTDDARNVALGFSGANTYGGTSYYQFDYFASYGFDYLSAAHFFNNDKYAVASTLTNSSLDQLSTINNSSNFTYTFWLKKNYTDNTNETIFWLGDRVSGDTAIRTSIVNISSSLYLNIKIVNNSGTIKTLQSVNSIDYTSVNHIAIIKNGSSLSLYINSVFDSTIDLDAGFVIKNISSSDPCFTFGGDGAGASLGDSAGVRLLNGYISEFAMFDYALSIVDIDVLFRCVYNQGTLPVQTIDKYYNAECIIDGILEETLQFAITNMLNSHGNIIKANNDIYCMSANSDIFRMKANVTTELDKNFEDNYGWMSRVQSQNDKTFNYHDYVEIDFDNQKCNKILITTGYLNSAINTIDYIITKSDNTTIEGVGISFAGSSYIYINLDDTYIIKSVRIIPMTTVYPNDYARIYTINPIWEVDLSDYVVSYKVSKVRENFDASLPIGSTSANNGSLVLDNSNKDFNIFGDTLYGNYATPDVPFFISLDYELPEYGTNEEIVLAQEMYADTWSFNNSNMTVDVNFRDYSKYLQEKTLNGYIGQEITAGRGIMDMLLLAGFPRRKIVFNDKYENSILSDDPYVYMQLNETSSYLSSNSGKFQDQCGYVYMQDIYSSTKFSSSSIVGVTNKSLIYSEIIDVQDDANRPNYQNILSTFEPSYKEGSYKVGNTNPGTVDPYAVFSINSSGNEFRPIDTGSNSWSTELFHFVDPSYDTSSGVKNDIARSTNSSSRNSNYILQYECTSTQVKYYWSFYDTTNTIHTINSNWLDRAIPHLIDIKKIGGSSNIYNLYIDGILVSTMSPSVSIIPFTTTTGLINSFSLFDYNGYISNISFYNYALTDDRIAAHYISSSLVTLPTFKYIYAAKQTYWDAMLAIATADLGMFYFDEYGIFNYEYRNLLHDSKFNRYQNSQYNFSDSTDILNGKFNVEIQSNKVTVPVNKTEVKVNNTTALWSAPSGASLVVSTITQDVSPYSSSISLNLKNSLSGSDDIFWLGSGYVKIDNEIIKYKSFDGNNLNDIERGQFGTDIVWHKNGTLAREARYYNMIYSSSPAVSVKYPFITNTNVDIDLFYSNSYYTDIVVSANASSTAGTYVILQGTDLEKINQLFEIAGDIIGSNQSSELITNISRSINSNVRRYGIKELKIDSSYIQNKNYAQLVADFVIGYYTEPVRILNIEVLGVPHLQLGDLITIDNFSDLGISNEKYWITQNDIDYDGSIKQSLSLKAYTDTISPPKFVFGSGSYVPSTTNSGTIYFPSGF